MCLLLLMKDGLLKLREITPTVYAGVILPPLCNSLGVKSLEELIQICLHNQSSVSPGSTADDSTNHESKIFGKKFQKAPKKQT